ncbi:MAG: UbiD family decarboxylase [Planctomycetes bacterium]|jgi:UbiD family decarboxylase|nr:UbiD family decarboxylase [Planctomycetota bacterium]
MGDRPVRNLREQLALLRARGDLFEVRAEVDARLEIAEIHRRTIAAGGPALLFRNVRGSDFPVVTNLYGTPERVRLAFGERPLKLVERAVRAAETLLPPSLGKLWSLRGLARDLLRIGARRVRRGPILEVSEAPHLDRLPVLTCWQADGGPFVTLPLVFTEHPKTRKSNLGMYRLQIHGPALTGMHFQIGKGGGFHLHAAEEAGRALPVTVFLGGPPALTLAAIAPLPEDVPEILLASLLLGEKLPRVAHEPHPLVAEAEFALTGRVAPGVRRPEGPFGDHYGYLSLRHDYPVFEVERVFRRRDAIWPATVVGRPRQEDYHIGEYLQELLAPLFPLVMPAVRSLWSYGETGFHSLAAAVVRDRYPREALASAFRILGEGQLSLTKVLLVTDRTVDLRDFRAVLRVLLERLDARRDLFVFPGTSQDTLDYTGPRVNEGSKAVLLALGEARRVLPERYEGGPPPGARRVEVFAPGALVVEGERFAAAPDLADRVAAWPGLDPWPLAVLVDDAVEATRSVELFLWTTFTRMTPAADLHGREVRDGRFHTGLAGPVVIDARMKPSYPPVLEVDDETRDLVDRRWTEYGIPVPKECS